MGSIVIKRNRSDTNNHVESLSTGVMRSIPDFPEFVYANRCWLYDRNNVAFFDGISGFGANSLGHQHPRVNQAAVEQINKLFHTGCKLSSLVRKEMIHKLGNFSPFSQSSILPAVTGAEAVEAATKIVRAYTKRKPIIAFDRSFHGKTTGALSLTWRDELKSYSVIPYDSVLRAKYPILHSAAEENHPEACLYNYNKLLEDACNSNNHPAAVIVEPVQITEGVLSAGKKFLEGIIKISKKYNCLVIFDEVHTGFGRCGSAFYCNKLDEKPDIIIVGKSLANGFPLSAVIGDSSIVDALPAGVQTSTYSGHPVSCAVASAVIDVMVETEPWNKANIVAQKIHQFLANMEIEYGFISCARGEGMVFGFDCIARTGEPSSSTAQEFIEVARENRLILIGGGFSEATVMFEPPLVMDEKDLDFLLTTLKRIMDIIENKKHIT
jgi:4-aminobutyrate aminotransferase/(S)-3-amino-2-methylpropionate transaminase